jgi:tRNA nucleotidyltransferase (CCA-adding enzyme)
MKGTVEIRVFLSSPRKRRSRKARKHWIPACAGMTGMAKKARFQQALKIYLVGGAVRDKLLGLPVKERDWVVVGATPAEMIKLGYKQVGKDFPVFLHPKTHEEYALARTERKIGKGYTAFTFYTDPTLTLEEDLQRRDLTINAIAQTKNGRLIDPFNGQQDLKQKILRHVSAAFAEDPVRILRVGRFASRFGDFKIDPITMHLMRNMAAAGEVDALVPERVWQELQRALNMPYPWRFFETLKTCGALRILFPELQRHFTKSQTALKHSVTISDEPLIRFIGLISPLSVRAIKSLCNRIKAPRHYHNLAILVAKYKKQFLQANKFNAKEILQLFEKLDAFRQKEKFWEFLTACENFSKKQPSPQFKKLNQAYKIAAKISAKPLIAQGFKGEAIKHELHKLRIKKLQSGL